jgi:thiamine-phosphate pyrophosphorylase
LRRIDVSLYVILDPDIEQRFPLETFTRMVIDGGTTCLQVRCKQESTREILAFTRRIVVVAKHHRIPVIVNDRVDIALAASAQGVHLGEEDLGVAQARSIAGETIIIGATVRDIVSARQAAAAGADYLGVGPMFGSPTKPNLRAISPETLDAISREISLPIVAIGGINETNAAVPLRHGADGIAVVSALRECPDPKEAASHLRAAIDEAKKR